MFYHQNHCHNNKYLNFLLFLMILFDLQMIFFCQLFYLKNHFFLLLFCFDLLFHHNLHLHFHFHNLRLHFHIDFHNLYSLLFYFLLFYFLDFLMFCQLKLYLINHEINLITFYVQGYAFYTLLILLFLFRLMHLNFFKHLFH